MINTEAAVVKNKLSSQLRQNPFFQSVKKHGSKSCKSKPNESQVSGGDMTCVWSAAEVLQIWSLKCEGTGGVDNGRSFTAHQACMLSLGGWAVW